MLVNKRHCVNYSFGTAAILVWLFCIQETKPPTGSFLRRATVFFNPL